MRGTGLVTGAGAFGCCQPAWLHRCSVASNGFELRRLGYGRGYTSPNPGFLAGCSVGPEHEKLIDGSQRQLMHLMDPSAINRTMMGI